MVCFCSSDGVLKVHEIVFFTILLVEGRLVERSEFRVCLVQLLDLLYNQLLRLANRMVSGTQLQAWNSLNRSDYSWMWEEEPKKQASPGSNLNACRPARNTPPPCVWAAAARGCACMWQGRLMEVVEVETGGR